MVIPSFFAKYLVPGSWVIRPTRAIHDLDNIRMSAIDVVEADFELEHILVEGKICKANCRSCLREGNWRASQRPSIFVED